MLKQVKLGEEKYLCQGLRPEMPGMPGTNMRTPTKPARMAVLIVHWNHDDASLLPYSRQYFPESCGIVHQADCNQEYRTVVKCSVAECWPDSTMIHILGGHLCSSCRQLWHQA